MSERKVPARYEPRLTKPPEVPHTAKSIEEVLTGLRAKYQSVTLIHASIHLVEHMADGGVICRNQSGVSPGITVEVIRAHDATPETMHVCLVCEKTGLAKSRT